MRGSRFMLGLIVVSLAAGLIGPARAANSGPQVQDPCGLTSLDGSSYAYVGSAPWEDVCRVTFTSGETNEAKVTDLVISLELPADTKPRPDLSLYAVGWYVRGCQQYLRYEDDGGPLGTRVLALDHRCDRTVPCDSPVPNSGCSTTIAGETTRVDLPLSAAVESGNRITISIDGDLLPPAVGEFQRKGTLATDSFAVTWNRFGLDSSGGYIPADYAFEGTSFTIG